jgi:hypothetical protein
MIPTYLLQNLSDSEPIWFWTYLIPNLSDSESIWNWTHQISNLRPIRADVSVLVQCTPLPSVLSWQQPIRPIRSCREISEETGQSQSPLPPGQDDRRPLPVRPVAKMGTKHVNPSPIFPRKFDKKSQIAKINHCLSSTCFNIFFFKLLRQEGQIRDCDEVMKRRLKTGSRERWSIKTPAENWFVEVFNAGNKIETMKH